MTRYIDASEIRYTYRPHTQDNIAYKDEIDKIPTADVAPVIHAHWERKAYFPDGTPAWVCSRCGHPEEEKYSHCNCGAKMDEEEKETTPETSSREWWGGCAYCG